MIRINNDFITKMRNLIKVVYSVLSKNSGLGVFLVIYILTKINQISSFIFSGGLPMTAASL